MLHGRRKSSPHVVAACPGKCGLSSESVAVYRLRALATVSLSSVFASERVLLAGSRRSMPSFSGLLSRKRSVDFAGGVIPVLDALRDVVFAHRLAKVPELSALIAWSAPTS